MSELKDLEFKSNPDDFGPRIGDELFKEDEDRRYNARLDWPQEHWESYIDGYKRTGDLLVEHVKSTCSERETLVYPIVFSYRQYFELRLKVLIRNGCKILCEHIGKNLFKKHDLEVLWKKCRPILEKIFKRESKESPELLDRMGICLRQLNCLDSTSQGFRYPSDTEGNFKLPDIQCIGLSNFSEVVSRMARFLDSCSIAMEEYDRRGDW